MFDAGSLKDKRVAVLGLGRSGVAACKFLKVHKANVIAIDEKENIAQAKVLESLGVSLRLGKSEAYGIEDADLVVKSPGVPFTFPGLKSAHAKGKVISEIALARMFIKKPVISVTGTNGKTTTATLISHLIEVSGKKSCLAGNVGTPLISQIEAANSSDYVVAEISSFQLEDGGKFESDVAVWLNLTPDHLDRHGDLKNYAEAKGLLIDAIKPGGLCVYNFDDKTVLRRVEATKVRALPFSSSPQDFGEGAYIDGKKLVFKFGGHKREIDSTILKIHGMHNYTNALASGLAALSAGVPFDDIIKGLKNFAGLPHRVEFIRSKDGVEYYNDSKGTNTGATAAALLGFDKMIVLIAGGREKKTGWDELVSASQGKLKCAVLIGEAAQSIARALHGIAPVHFAKTMDEAVVAASRLAQSGEIVLLSPACASYDMFTDYAARGEAFRKAVLKL